MATRGVEEAEALQAADVAAREIDGPRTLLPEVAGLMGEVMPFNWSGFEAGWQNFLANLQSRVNELPVVSLPSSSVSWIAAAALTTTALELARRRYKTSPEELVLLEGAGVRVFGLKHPPMP
jgi:hypothetical protein